MRRLALALVAVAAAAWAAPAHADTWCGTAAPRDRPQQAVAGPPVHVLYVHPSDAPDRSAALAQSIHDDVTAIDAWWRGQDAARTPRFDLFAFACGPQVDLSAVRLSRTSAALTASDTRADLIVDELFSGGFGSTFTKYLVYVDGPTDDADLCGQGGGELRQGPAYALVFLGACEGIPRDGVAAHELVHAFGALAPGAPNACEDDDGHTCDAELDLLYPFATETPLAQLVLDLNRDDYYGHGTSRVDVRLSPWLRTLDAQVPLSVALAGRGSVQSDVPGVFCSAACTSQWDRGAEVGLSARPAAGQRFVRWSGACTGPGTCSLGLGAARSVSALFAPARFRVAVSVAGRGRIASRPARLSCPTRCAASFTSYEPVRLTATAASGWRLGRWTGACAASRTPVCTLPLRAAASARAVFVRR